MRDDTPFDVYLAGEKLYGDDFDLPRIQQWYEDEREGYAQVGSKKPGEYRYVYHALNAIHGFRHLPDREFNHALGFGSAHGDEFEPIAHRLQHVTILEPSEVFRRSEIHGIPAVYDKPAVDGTLPYGDQRFDLVTCLGVLHHIANVTHVVSEQYRCLRPGGFALLREPIVSMGDWRRPRPGLTKHERGVPLPFLQAIVEGAGFTVVNRALCVFPPIARLWQTAGREAYNSSFATRLDCIVSDLLRWNLRYHATSIFEKLRPTCAFYVLTKQTR